jgi:hypothetical protein
MLDVASNPTPQQWAATLLQRLGIPQSPGALQALVGWERAEGGHWNNSARYNPLNTTQRMPGYKTFQSVGQGSAPIGIYNSWQQGIDATIKTLRNGRYGGILKALQAGNPPSVSGPPRPLLPCRPRPPPPARHCRRPTRRSPLAKVRRPSRTSASFWRSCRHPARALVGL